MKEVDNDLEEKEEEILEDDVIDEMLDEADEEEKRKKKPITEKKEEKVEKPSKAKKIPTYHDNDILPVKDKLVTFLDGYLVTLDKTDINILNKLTGQEREDYLRNIKAESNQKLIYKVANRLLRFEPNTIVKVDFEELIAAGWHALAKAINTYDYSKGWLFTTYAYKIIMNEMIQEIKRVKKKVVTKIDGEKIESLAIHISMDAPIKNDNKGNDIYVSDMISDTADGPEAIMEKDSIKNVIMQCLDELNPTEKYVVIYRYGLDRDIILTQKEIAEKLEQNYSIKVDKKKIELKETIKTLGITKIQITGKYL